jgi:hypothetical protein
MSKRIKSFKEYDDAYFSGTGGFSIGSLDSLKPMSDLGPTDRPPRNFGPGDNRGTVAVYANKKVKQNPKKLTKEIKNSPLYKHMVDTNIIKD